MPSKQESAPKELPSDELRAPTWWILGAILLFVLRCWPYATAEFWYDEILTILNFLIDPRETGFWHSIFRTYPIANNHILSTAVHGLWLRMLGMNVFPEILLRMPSLLLGAGTIWLIIRGWRRTLGTPLAILGGYLFAASPVFVSYAWQLRGYSLTCFLAACACTGLLKYTEGARQQGLWLLGGSLLLLPLVIPANAMLPLALGIACLGLPAAPKDSRHSRNFRLFCFCGLAGALGLAYYLTIWPQFTAAMKEPDGWPSRLTVLGYTLGGFACHLLTALALLGGQLSRRAKGISANPIPENTACATRPDRTQTGCWLLAGTLLSMAPALLLSAPGHAPFPRVFLVLLVPMTLGILLVMQPPKTTSPWHLLSLIAMITSTGCIITQMSSNGLQAKLRKESTPPDNLLQQYYRGSSDLKNTIDFLQHCLGTPADGSVLLSDLYDQPTLSFYAGTLAQNRIRILSLHDTPLSLPAVTATRPGPFRTNTAQPPAIFILARTPEIARQLAKTLTPGLTFDTEFRAIASIGSRSLYQYHP